MLDIIERKQLLFPLTDGLPSTAAFIHRGGEFSYNLKSVKDHADCLSVLIEGTAFRGVSGKLRKIMPGSLFVSLEGEEVIQKACDGQDQKVILFCYREENVRKMLRNAWGWERLISDAPPVAQTLMKAMYDELLNPKPFRSQLLLTYHHSLMIMIARHSDKNQKHSKPASNLYNEAMHLIQCFPEEIPSLYELSERLGVSREHIIRIFKQKGGESPYQILLRSRMERARDWLENTNWNIMDIAEKLGYNNPNSFIRTYKKLIGQTPTQSRISNDSPGKSIA